jgi:ATP-dependent RNA helicase SUPV3L1/SUV3
MALRAQLWAMSRNIDTPGLPAPGLVALQKPEPGMPTPPVWADWPPGFAATIGWIEAGPVLLRLDVAERIAAELGYLTRRAPAPPPPDLASRLGVKADTLGVTLTALGFRLMEPQALEEGQYGPPTPLRIAQPRPQHHARGGDRRPQGQPQGQLPRQPLGQPQGQRDRRPPQQARPQPPEMPEGMFGPPVPPELLRGPRPPRHGKPHHQQGRPQHQGKGPPQHRGPRPEGRPEGRPEHRAEGRAEGRPEGRPDQHRPDQHRPRQDGPPRGPRPSQPPRKPEPRINPDSPFAILAQLKLR